MISTATYPPRSSRSDFGGYRYFFNGQEADKEVLGEGVLIGYEFRQYDARLGRWWGVDPMVRSFPGESPYAFCYGNPIIAKDCNGGYGVIVIHQQRDENGDVIGGTATLVMTFYYNSAENFEGLGKIGVDTKIHGGTRMMDYTDPNYGIPVPMRWIMMEDIENLFYDGNDRLHIIYENE